MHKRQAERLAELKAANDPPYRLAEATGEIGRLEAMSSRWKLTDEDLAAKTRSFMSRIRNSPTTTSEVAAETILNGVKADAWRILVGKDVVELDEAVRARPLEAYDAGFPAKAKL